MTEETDETMTGIMIGETIEETEEMIEEVVVIEEVAEEEGRSVAGYWLPVLEITKIHYRRQATGNR